MDSGLCMLGTDSALPGFEQNAEIEELAIGLRKKAEERLEMGR